MDPIDRPKRPNPLGSHPVNQRRERRRRSTSDIQKLYRTYREFLTTPMSNNLNMFPSFLESSNANNVGAPPRMTPSSAQQQPPNGNGMNGMPMLAGQQMDVNLLYQKVCELSDVLKENREKTQVIVKKAEELATRAAVNGANLAQEAANSESLTARIVDLERKLSCEKNNVAILMDEQKKNIELIGDYEHGMGEVTRMVRESTYNVHTERNNIAKHWNGQLQAEKDSHLQTRYELNDANAKVVKLAGMLREAYRLRCEEEDVPIRVIAGLQNEVRAYRSALGMEPEKFEDEFGYEILKDVKNGAGEP